MRQIINPPKKVQNKQKKPHEVPFVLANCSLPCDQPWSVIDKLSDIPWGKFSLSQQVSNGNIFFIKGGTFLSTSPSQCLDFYLI